MIYLSGIRRGDAAIMTVPMSGGTALPVVKTMVGSSRTRLLLSPDNHFLLYNSSPTGAEELFLTRYPSGEGKWQIFHGAASPFLWSRDGRTIYFASENRLMAASLTESPSPVVGEPRMLFDATPINVSLDRTFQLLADGTFIAVQDLPSDKRQVVLVQNWFAEFRDEEK